MNWREVGEWIKANAGGGAALVGSLLTGNVPAAMAAGIGLVASATGADDPQKAMEVFAADPDASIKLKQLYYDNEQDIRRHIEAIKLAELETEATIHDQTQRTIRAGDSATDKIVRLTRPSHATISLLGAIIYVFTQSDINENVLFALLCLPFTYAGLRQIGKGIDSFTARPTAKGRAP